MSLVIENLKKSYREPDGGRIPVLNVSRFELQSAEQVVLVGSSGGGKTTLLNVIAGITVPDSGRVIIDNIDVTRLNEPSRDRFRAQKIGFVFQTFNLIPTLSALKNVELPMVFQKIPRKDRHQKASQLLEQVGLGERLNHKPSELSGGERQRVSIARALVNDPQILLADEPTGNLDAESGEQVMRILKQLNETKKVTVIVVTHNPEVASFAHRIIHMKYGQVEGISNNGGN